MLATQDAQVIPPTWMKHFEYVLAALPLARPGSESSSVSLSFPLPDVADRAWLRTDGGLQEPAGLGTRELVSVKQGQSLH